MYIWGGLSKDFPMTYHWNPVDEGFWNGDSQDPLGSSLLPWHSSLIEAHPRFSLPRGSMDREGMLPKTVFNEDEALERYLQVLTSHLGAIPSDLEKGLCLGVEVFILSEECGNSPETIKRVWQHSLKTGYMAALISKSQCVAQHMIWQAFVGGLLHDIGMLVFLTQQPEVFMTVVDIAQCQGQDLATIEKHILGTTHAESGAMFLARWGIDKELLTIVRSHDEPFLVPHADFSSLTAVYAANLLEGGGIAQDGDGVVGCSGETYLTRLGLWDDLPIWQGWMRDLHHLPV